MLWAWVGECSASSASDFHDIDFHHGVVMISKVERSRSGNGGKNKNRCGGKKDMAGKTRYSRVGKRYGGIVARFPAKIIQNLWRAHIPPTASSLIVGLASQTPPTRTPRRRRPPTPTP